MSRTCGATIALNNWFGEVTFDPSLATRDFTHNYCNLYVTPKKLDQDKTIRVVVYFTEFDVGDDCNRGGLTMYDTYDKDLVAYSRSGMCGRNNTLTDGSTVFIIQHGTLILNYTWSSGNFDKHSHDFHSIFTLKFNSFYEYTDDCNGEDLHRCSNSRCVHRDAYCQTEMNGCGYTKADQCERDADAVTETADDENILTTIWHEISQYIWLLVVGVIFYTVFRCMRNPNSCIRNTQIGERIHARFWPNGLNQRRSPIEHGNTISHTNDQTENNVQETDLNHINLETSSTSSSERDMSQRAESPTRSLRLEDETNLPSSTLPSAPPPSYDEVAAPSYEHYMSNQDMYKAPGDKS